MTTRAQLESEREALVELRRYCTVGATPPHAALTASIARVEALLSLSDDDVRRTVESIDQTLVEAKALGSDNDFATRVLRTVADIVRRS